MIVYGILRDCAHQIRQSAEKELNLHTAETADAETAAGNRS